MIDTIEQRRRSRQSHNCCTGCADTCPCSRCRELQRENDLRTAEFAKGLLSQGQDHSATLADIDARMLDRLFPTSPLDPIMDELRAALVADPTLIADIQSLIRARTQPQEATTDG